MVERRIVLGTDFSAPAAHAAAAAARLVHRPEDVVVVHAVLPPAGAYGDLSTAPVPSQFAVYPPVVDLAEMRTRLASWAREVGLDGAELRVVEGEAGVVMANEARRAGATLAVVGAKGYSAVERVLLGTTAWDVVRRAPCDVLVVRGAPPVAGPLFPHVVVATDFQPLADRATRRAHAWARATGARVSLVHVRDRTLAGMALEPENAAPRLRAINAALLEGRAAEEILEGKPQKEIARFLGEHGASLLVIGSRNQGWFERLLLGSVAEDLVERAPCSVLVVRPEPPG